MISDKNLTGTVSALIVGAGHAGAMTAIALRREGCAGSVLIVGAEADLPYERPHLSKDYLIGATHFEQMRIRPPDFYDARQIQLRLNTSVERIDPALRRVLLSDGTSIDYGWMVWATGGKPRKLSCPGHDLPGVHSIRTRTDVDQFRSEMPTVRNVAIVGGGYIGLEAAAALRKLEKGVTIIEAQDRVLTRVAGEPLARFYEAEHGRQGVGLRLGEQVASLEERRGRVSAVRLASGERLRADAVVVGIGIIPEIGPLTHAGAAGSDGVDVDECCQTSLPGIFAVGDVARHRSRFASGQWVRIESVQNAADQAAVVARCLAGKPTPYDAVPWFWSNQYDLRLQTVGLTHSHDDVIVRGDPATRSFSVVYLRRKTVIALDCVNAPRDYVQGKALVAAGSAPDRSALADMSMPLKFLTR